MLRIVHANPNRGQREQLREAAISHAGVVVAGMTRDGMEAVQMAVQYRPDVAILTEDLATIDGYEAASLIRAVAPAVKTIMLVEHETPEVLRRAMRVGIRECVPRKAPPEQVLATTEELHALDAVKDRPEYQSALDPERFPRIIAVTGAKGGIGKTSTTVNLAVELARAKRGDTCLVDLYTQFGDVGTALNVKTPQTLVDLVSLRELDADVLEAATAVHSSGLHVLLGASTPQALDALPLNHLERIFGTLRQRYRYIVVDVPNFLHAGTIRVLESAHRLLLLCNLMDVTAVTDTRRWIDAIASSVAPLERIRLVLTRVVQDGHLDLESVEKILGMKVYAQVPNDYKVVSMCANKGTPFVLEAPNSAVSQAVRKLAQSIMEDNNGVSPEPTPVKETRRFSLFGRG